ncbi:hypothetical protein PAXINDRAFT_19162 [Paxillus involutus ATCC 200175]|uniref:Uncharacterized protein n=1 Tax=Paxillus involutus ATCC 200175 TaxID=664439 RepID=A0A0C9TK41_PAXIN|nr:hypothetical protein PAXINDRAFT_19162 [Paxillus involutus ATCC 200175]
MSHPASTSAAHAAEPEPSTSSLHATAVKTNAPAVAPLPSRFKIGTNHKKYLDAHDGKVFCHIPPRVITSPNAPSIPRPFIYENEPVQCRADGRYGYVNIYQWPQMFCEEYPWGVVYPVKGMYWETDPLARLWWTPMYADFVPLADTTLVVSFLSQEKRNKLNKVQDVIKNRYMLYKKSKVPECNPRDQGERIMLIMRNNYNHLDRFPLTWHDIITAVAEFQRSVMECFTYFNYHQMILPSVQTPVFPYPEYNPYWLGAFTCNPGVAETLFRAGVPVWLIRHKDTVTANTSLLAKVVPREPEVVLAMFTDPVKHFARPFPVRYVGPSNYKCSLACRRFLRQDQMEMWQVTPTNAAGHPLQGHRWQVPPRQELSLRRIAKQSVNRGPIKKHRIPIVQLADRAPTERQKASRDETCVTHRLPAGYRYPELTVFANVGAPASRKRYLANWLALRPMWLARIAAEPTALPTPPMWHMFLNSQPGDTTSTTRAGAKKAEAWAFFADALGDVPDGASTWAGDATVGFRGTAVQIASLADPPLPLIHAVLWELAELSFRSDLLTLDKALVPQLWDAPIREAQYLAIFSSEVIGGMWDTPLPQQHQGLFWGALSNPRALDFADAFRLLLSAWPSAPQGIEEPLLVTIPQNELQKKVNMLMEFYVQTFFFSTGRPPVVLCGYPGSWVA